MIKYDFCMNEYVKIQDVVYYNNFWNVCLYRFSTAKCVLLNIYLTSKL